MIEEKPNSSTLIKHSTRSNRNIPSRRRMEQVIFHHRKTRNKIGKIDTLTEKWLFQKKVLQHTAKEPITQPAWSFYLFLILLVTLWIHRWFPYISYGNDFPQKCIFTEFPSNNSTWQRTLSFFAVISAPELNDRKQLPLRSKADEHIGWQYTLLICAVIFTDLE